LTEAQSKENRLPGCVQGCGCVQVAFKAKDQRSDMHGGSHGGRQTDRHTDGSAPKDKLQGKSPNEFKYPTKLNFIIFIIFL